MPEVKQEWWVNQAGNLMVNPLTVTALEIVPKGNDYLLRAYMFDAKVWELDYGTKAEMEAKMAELATTAREL